MQYPFGQLAPDAKETAGGIVTRAQNVLPLIEGYGPMPSLQTPAMAQALSAAPRGIASVVLRGGAYVVHGFTATTIEQLQSDDTWTSIASGFSCTAGDDWSTEHFGDFLLATNTTDGLQAYDVESAGSVSAIAEAGDPRFIFSCANLVVALDCLDNSSTRNNRLIRTSAFGDHTNWKTKGADYQPLKDGEELIGGVSLKNNAALIAQGDQLRLMQFGNAGGGAMFSLQEISGGRGLVGAKSLIGFDGGAYGLSANGFWQFSVEGLRNIGAGKIDEWFFNTVDVSRLAEVQGSVDPSRKMVWWRFPAATTVSETVFDDLIGYSWAFDRWVTAKAQTAYLSRIATPGYALDAMDDFGPLDSIDIPLDSRFWEGGAPLFAALDSAYKFATFSGGAMVPLIESRTANSVASGMITSVTPITDSATATVAVGVSDRLSDPLAWKTPVAIKPSGRCPQRARGKNAAFRFSDIANADWTYIKGIDHIEANAGGVR